MQAALKSQSGSVGCCLPASTRFYLRMPHNELRTPLANNCRYTADKRPYGKPNRLT